MRTLLSIACALAMVLAMCGMAFAGTDIEDNNVVAWNDYVTAAVDNDVQDSFNTSVVKDNVSTTLDASVQDNDGIDVDEHKTVTVDESLTLEDICVCIDASKTTTISTTLDNSNNTGVIIQKSEGVSLTQISGIQFSLTVMMANSFNEDSYNVKWENVANTNYDNVGNQYWNNVGNEYDISLEDVGNEYTGSFNTDKEMSWKKVNVGSFNEETLTMTNVGNDYSTFSEVSTDSTCVCGSLNGNDLAVGAFNWVD
jgi:hypothetical protein